LSLSITLMVVGTLLITVMPSYEAIGIIAPIGILLARLLPWGFRIPFAIGLLVGPIGYYAIRSLDLPASTGFAAALVSGIALLVATPLAGHLSDQFGQIRLMIPAAGLILVLIYPLFALLVAFPGLGVMLGMMAVVGVLKGTVLRPDGRGDGEPVPARHACHRYGGGLQHRGGRLRRVHAVDPHMADQQHRQRPRAELRGDDHGGGQPDQHGSDLEEDRAEVTGRVSCVRGGRDLARFGRLPWARRGHANGPNTRHTDSSSSKTR
jgi:hypothetical protein